MKQLTIIAIMLISSTAFCRGPNRDNRDVVIVIACTNNVTVYARGEPVEGMSVLIEFPSGTQLVREDGVLAIRSDKSLLANSKSAVVYGNQQSSGYFILSPARDPYPGHCQSF